MGDELPILKGILNGVVNYHNARRCLSLADNKKIKIFSFFIQFEKEKDKKKRECTFFSLSGRVKVI